MLCECGCGQETKYYPTKKAKIGIPSGGGYARFVSGHHNRIIHPRGNTVLDEFDVRRIRKLLKTNRMSQPQIAKRFGVHAETIGAIHRGKTWTQVA